MNRQAAQAERRAAWEEQGHLEWPQQLTTMLQRHQRRRFDWLREHCEGTILELGCNWGFVLAYVHGHTGIDIAPESLEIARQLNREATFIEADLTTIKEPHPHDTVIVPDVLEHLPFAKVPYVLKYALVNARKRVLVTMPDGRQDSAEATNFKHQWLCDEEKIEALHPLLGYPVCDGTFLYWKVDV